MDDLPNGLAALIADARVAHDPSAEELRHLAAGLGAVIPGFASVAVLTEGVVHGAADLAVQGGLQGASIKAAWLGSASAAKVVGALMSVAVAGTAITAQQLSVSPVQSSQRARAATKPAARSVPSATEPPPPLVPSAAPAEAPVVAPLPVPREETLVQAPAKRQRTAKRPPKPRAHVAGNGSSEELALIEGALGALHRHDPVLAERFLRAHASRFKDGQLARERAGLTLIALCEQGRIAEAEPEKTRFLQDNAGSPIAARVARACR